MRSIGEETAALLRSDSFDRWMGQASATGFCSHPVRLSGSSTTLNVESGEVLATYTSAQEPGGTTYVRCGNRRSIRCPSCSSEYKNDAFHLISAGASGGKKGVPESIATHPLVFATLTAPSFGAVHALRTSGKGAAPCRPRATKRLCPHGRPMWCMERHTEGDHSVGEPLCQECYDYDAHLVWQWHAPELWRRFTIRLRREIALMLGTTERTARDLVRVQFAKVAEFQRRGVVHFHALIRLDGPATESNPFPIPGVDVSSNMLAELVLRAVSRVEYVADSLPGETRRLTLRWGSQVDARPVSRQSTQGNELTAQAVAAYVAKYATKATEEIAPPGAQVRPHIACLRKRITELSASFPCDATSREPSEPCPDDTYRTIGRWVEMLGFRGHFATKSRRYSTTFTALRNARKEFRRVSQLSNLVDAGRINDEEFESISVIGDWTFTGMGWRTTAEAALANAAQSAAREWQMEQRKQRKRRNK